MKIALLHSVKHQGRLYRTGEVLEVDDAVANGLFDKDAAEPTFDLSPFDADATPTPETDATPTPETDATPTPETDATPTPETDATPTPETDATPTPETDATPTPETTADAD